MTSLKHQTISGVKWSFIAGASQRTVSFAATIILARILSPADFGLFALAFVMIDGFQLFKSLGFDSALVRRKDDIDKAANTAFFLIPAMGIILFVILLFIAPLGARFLNNPDVAGVIRALSIIFVISCFAKVPQTILYRNMQFKYKSIAEICSTVIYSASAVILAINKFGVWSLVIAYILRFIVQASMEWYYSGWRPKLEFDKKIAREMFQFGKYVLAGGIIWFLTTNLDNLIVGKFLGVTMLGYYAIARNTSNLLSEYFLSKVSMIMYPAYSKIQENPDDVKQVALKTLRYVSIIVLPFGFGLFIFAPDILRLVFGEKWLPATSILRFLAFAGILKSLGATVWPAILAKGRSKIDFQISLIQIIILFVLLVFLSAQFKLIGVGIAVLMSTAISFYIGLVRIDRILRIRISEYFAAIKPALLSSLVMLSGGLLLKPIKINCNTNYSFIIVACGLFFAYFLTTYLMNRNILKDIKETLA